jgi:H+/Cl- antiporter ClcA
MGYAVALGIFGGLAALVFLGVIDHGEMWNVDSNPHWFGAHWWWVAVTAGAGLIVGVLHRLLRVPEQTPGIIAEIKTGQVDAPMVPAMVVISAVSLIGGASLGPEKALGSVGGGAGTWIAKRRKFDSEDSQVNVLSGMAGAYGGLLSSPAIAVMMFLEVGQPGGNRFTKILFSTLIASSVSFGIYFAIAGAVFLDIYKVPQYQFHDWQLLAAVPLGLFSAVVVTALVICMAIAARAFSRLPQIARSVLAACCSGSSAWRYH